VGSRDSHVLTDEDCEVLNYLQQVKTSSVSFCDKYKSGATVVFYVPKGEHTSIISFVRGIVAMTEKKEPVEGRRGKAIPTSYLRRSWKYIDMLGRYPAALSRFTGDLSMVDRAVYYSYVAGQELSESEGQALDTYALNVLIWEGRVASVIPPTRGSGVDSRTPKKLENGGEDKKFDAHPKLPF